MASTEPTPRYRNFSNNMPSSMNPNAHASTSLITIEKEPEPNPEDQCFICRQAHVYVKPIGMHQERRVAYRHPPPLSRAEIDELSRKKNLTKLEVRKLLQCYFPEIKNVKYFQLHKFHSCCYDPKHLNLCKNHITALQREHGYQQGHEHNHDDHYFKEYPEEGEPKNKVSFLRIKIEPTKGIPTRFLGPQALPESLANMLLKQVNHVENKKLPPSLNTNNLTLPYKFRQINEPHGWDEDEDYEDEDDDESDSEDDHDDNEDNDGGTQIHGTRTAQTSPDFQKNTKEKLKSDKKYENGDLVVEDLDQSNHVHINHQHPTHDNEHPQLFSKAFRKKKNKKGSNKKGSRKPKLNHWEILALQQTKHETCNCRHQVMHVEDDQVHYYWCRCKDQQHKEIMERTKSVGKLPPLPPPPSPPKEPAIPPRPKRRPKPRKVHTKSIGIDAPEPTTTEIALAYDPSAVDYDMIQEAIYYRTASGRLIKPETTNAFTYEGIPSSMMINNQESGLGKSQVLYVAADGSLKSYDNFERNQRKPKTIVLSKPGSLYNGQATVDAQHASFNHKASDAVPVLKLPPVVNSATLHDNDNGRGYKPTEFTLAKFSSDHNIRSSNPQGRHNITSFSTQRSSKPTYMNQDPTPDFGRESSAVANRRWFDQPLGDQNLRPVQDGQYGLIAGTSTDSYQTKVELAENANHQNTRPDASKRSNNCTIS